MTFASPEAAAHNLLVHVQPREIEDRMYQVIEMNPDLAEDLLTTTDIPFQIANCPETHKPFIKCDYNRDGDSYRSPYSSRYVPDFPDGIQPPPNLREIEIGALKGLEPYKRLYYQNDGVISVYCWDTGEDDCFGIGIFVRKSLRDGVAINDQTPVTGVINSSDIFTVTQVGTTEYTYELASSALIEFNVMLDTGSPYSFSGTVSETCSKTLEANSTVDHLVNVFTIAEDQNQKFMSSMETVYFDKMDEILRRCRKSLDDPAMDDFQARQVAAFKAAVQ